MAHAFIDPYISLYAINHVGITPLQLGIFLTAASLSSILVDTWVGRISDTIRFRRELIVWVALIACAGYFQLIFIDSFEGLIVVSIVFLSLGSCTFPQVLAASRIVLKGSTDDANYDPTVAMRSMISLAWVIGPVFGALLVASFSYAGLLVATAALFLLVALISLRLPSIEKQSEIDEPSFSLRYFLTQHDHALTTIAYLLVGIATMTGTIALPLLIVNQLQGSEYMLGGLITLTAFCEIPLIVLLGGVVSTKTRIRLLAFGASLLIIYFSLLAVVTSVKILFFLQLISALAVAINMGVGISYFQNLQLDKIGAVTTLYVNIQRISMMIGSIVFGSFTTLFSFSSVYVACAFLSAGALIIFLLLIYRQKAG